MQLQIIIKLICIDLRFYKLLINAVQCIYFYKLMLIFLNYQSPFCFLLLLFSFKSSQTCNYFMQMKVNFKTL